MRVEKEASVRVLLSSLVYLITLIGTIATFASEEARSWMGNIVWICLAVVIVLSVFTAFQIFVYRGLIVAGVTIDGRWWMRDWRHGREVDDKEKTVSRDAHLKQFGNRVRGEFTNSQGKYIIRGKLRDRIFSGDWFEKTEDAHGWYGHFQFVVSPERGDMTTMDGRWVGHTTDKKTIGCGHWEWARLNKPFPSERKHSIPVVSEAKALGLIELVLALFGMFCLGLSQILRATRS